jgi:hypothetical protein
LTVLVIAIVLLVPLESRASEGGGFAADKLDQLVAPVALYPDNLLAQIMMASTYPLEVIEADRWVKTAGKMAEKDREEALASKTWDPSVSSLTAFPDVIGQMSANIDWMQDMGEAFLAQQKDVMDAVQRMRSRAQRAGSLKGGGEEVVRNEGTQIVIESPSPEMVYVPSYDPGTVYGSEWAPSSYDYPAAMAPWPGYVAGTVLSWGLGYACGAAMFGGFHWGYGGGCYVNHRYNSWAGYRGGNVNANVNVRGGNTVNWKHNEAHRRGVNYRNDTLRQQYGSRPGGDRRGYSGNRPGSGPGASRPGVGGNRPGTGTGTRPGTGTGTRPGTGTGTRPGTGTGTRPGTGTGTRPGTGVGNRPGTGTGTRPSAATRPSSGGNLGTRPGFGSSLDSRTRPTTSRPGSGYTPARSTATRGGGSGAFSNFSSGRAQQRDFSRGASSRGSSGGNFSRAGSAPSRSFSAGARSGGGRSGGGRRR